MNIAICEDYAPDAELLFGCVTDACALRHIQADISVYRDKDAFLRDFSPGKFQVAFLDIFLDDGFAIGFELGKELLAADKNLRIVFCTASPEFAAQSFGLGVSFYITKPFHPEHVAKAFEQVHDVLQKEMRSIVVKVNRQDKPLYLRDILYAETVSKKVLLHTTGGVFPVYTTLEALENQIRANAVNGNAFIRCHQAYLVNMDYVECAEGEDDSTGDFLMANGDRVLVRGRGRKAKYLLMDYMSDKLRGDCLAN